MTYTGALVREIREDSVRKDVEGIVVRVINAPFGTNLPQQVLVFWPGGDFVPDATEWHVAGEIEPFNPKNFYRADLMGFHLLSLDTDGYGFVYARNADCTEQACVQVERDSGNEGMLKALHEAVNQWAENVRK